MSRKSFLFFLFSALAPVAVIMVVSYMRGIFAHAGVWTYLALVSLPVILFAACTLLAGKPRYEKWLVTAAMTHCFLWLISHALTPIIELGQLYSFTGLPLFTVAGLLLLPWCIYLKFVQRKGGKRAIDARAVGTVS